MKSLRLNYILNNKTLGSSELVHLLNTYLISKENISEINKVIGLSRIKLGHFKAVNSYLNEINKFLRENDASKLNNFLKNYSNLGNEKFRTIFKKIYPILRGIRSVITISRSGTVVEILRIWHQKNKKFKVVVCESRPKLEGRLMAEDLASSGIKVELITDAMIGLYISNIDCAIVGADTILKNRNVINKVGSLALALLCKEYKKPFYVVTTKSKFSDKNKFIIRKESPNEVWQKKIKNLSVNNIYFEEIKTKFITKIFTD